MVEKWQRKSNLTVNQKTFSRASVSCKKDCMKPSLKDYPDHFILQVGKKDLSSEKVSKQIAKPVLHLACRLIRNIWQIIIIIQNNNYFEK